MSIIEYISPAKCKDCKYYTVKRYKNFPPYRGWCNLKQIETWRKRLVCDEWAYISDLLPKE